MIMDKNIMVKIVRINQLKVIDQTKTFVNDISYTTN
jgi:hypothetical protein